MSLLETAFPHLTADGYAVTAPSDPLYNCVAWAAGETGRWWWPDPEGEHYWPPAAPREESVDAFVAAFASLGYRPSADANPERGCVKVAVFARSGLPTHVTRQLPSGLWTSKLGPREVIEHTLDGLAGVVFGHVAVVLVRSGGSG